MFTLAVELWSIRDEMRPSFPAFYGLGVAYIFLMYPFSGRRWAKRLDRAFEDAFYRHVK